MLRRGNKASAKYWRQSAAACDRAVSASEHPQVLPGRCGLCQSGNVPIAGEGRLPIHHPHQVQRRAGAGNRASADPTRRSPFAQAEGLLSQLPVSREVVAAGAARGGQDRMARGRVVPACRIHRDQLEQAIEERREVLQRSRHSGAVDQGRQERRQMDEALLPHVQGQSDAAATVRLGL